MTIDRLSALTAPALIAILAAAPAPSAEPPAAEGDAGPLIRSHRFEGRAWIPDAVLEGHLGLPDGSRYGTETVRRGLENLLAWKYVEAAEPPAAVAVEDGRVDLVWPVVDRPLVRRVDVEVRPGGGPFDRKDLLEGLRTRAGEPLVGGDLLADREDLRARHRREGYYLCEVRIGRAPVGPGAVEVEFIIDLGPRAWIRSIEIEGAAEVPARHVRGALRSRPRILFGFISRGVFDPARWEEDAARARDFYRSRGYLEAMVSAEPILLAPAFDGIDLALRVEEGRRYRLAGTEIRGNGPGVPTELLRRQVRTKPGGFWDGKALDEDRRRLFRWYEEHYDWVPWIDVYPQFSLDPDDLEVTAVFLIQEGLHHEVGRVDISGNARTRDRVIRSLVSLRPAAPLTRTELNRSGDRLAASGFFDPEKSRMSAVEGGEVRTVDVRVAEKRTGLIQVGGGASTGEGEIAYLSIAQTNFDLAALPRPGRPIWDSFSGGGQILQFEFAPGTTVSRYDLRFEEPYLYNTRNSLWLKAGSEIWDRDGYDETRIGGELGVRHLWDADRRLSTGLAWVLEDVHISDLADRAPADVTDVRGHTLLSYPSLRLAWADLDENPYRGPAGLRVEAREDLSSGATGSRIGYARTLLAADLFRPVSAWINRGLGRDILSEEPGREHVVRIGGRFGWSDGLAGDDVPIFERFFLGGPRSFRGFDYRGVGPEADGVRVGGRSYWQGMLEYSFPVAIPEVRAVGLFDFGDVESRMGGFSAGGVRTAAGGGIRLRVKLLGQVVPVDLYFVQALARERGDDPLFFSFTLGFGF